MATTGFENEEKVDLSALARLSQNLFTADFTAAPTDAFRLTSNERSGVLNHRFGGRTEAPAIAGPASTTDFDFGSGAIDMSALAMPQTTVGEARPQAAPPTIKQSRNDFT